MVRLELFPIHLITNKLAVLKYVLMDHGVLFVMTFLMTMMLKLYVNSWDTHHLVMNMIIIILLLLSYIAGSTALNHRYYYYNEHAFPFHVVDLNCTGVEQNIWNCPSNGLLKCPSNVDAAISCLEGLQTYSTLFISYLYILVPIVHYANCSNGQLRLSGGSSPLDGRLEICYNNVWFAMCYTYSSLANQKVICEALGYSSQGKAKIILLLLN